MKNLLANLNDVLYLDQLLSDLTLAARRTSTEYERTRAIRRANAARRILTRRADEAGLFNKAKADE